MKKLLAIALTFTAATAFAEVDNNHEHCKSLSGLAESVMAHRQDGTSVVTLMELADLPVTRLLIEEAYKKPRYSSEQYQRRAVSDFRDEYYIICLKAMEK